MKSFSGLTHFNMVSDRRGNDSRDGTCIRFEPFHKGRNPFTDEGKMFSLLKE
jgi:hypothetical protein